MADLRVIIGFMRTLVDWLRSDDAGYSTETVVVTALLVALAVTVVGIIAHAVIDKAKSIQP